MFGYSTGDIVFIGLVVLLLIVSYVIEYRMRENYYKKTENFINTEVNKLIEEFFDTMKSNYEYAHDEIELLKLEFELLRREVDKVVAKQNAPIYDFEDREGK